MTSAQSLCASDAGLKELQTLLEANKDGLVEQTESCLAALESGALLPDQHALAWIHLLRAVAGPAPPRETPRHELDPAGETMMGMGSQGSDQPPAPSPAPSPAPTHTQPNNNSINRRRALHLTGDDAGGATGDRFANLASRLCASCPRTHAAKDPVKFARVCAELKDVAVAKARPAAAIAPLLRAVTIAAPTEDHLTAQHSHLFHACIAAKMPDAALNVLTKRVFEVEPKTTGVSVHDFLAYCLHGGEIYAALGRFGDACDVLEHAVRAPASAVSDVVVKCYKRLVLCALVAKGEHAKAESSFCRAEQLRPRRFNPIPEIESDHLRMLTEMLKCCTDERDRLEHQMKQSAVMKSAAPSSRLGWSPSTSVFKLTVNPCMCDRRNS